MEQVKSCYGASCLPPVHAVASPPRSPPMGGPSLHYASLHFTSLLHETQSCFPASLTSPWALLLLTSPWALLLSPPALGSAPLTSPWALLLSSALSYSHALTSLPAFLMRQSPFLMRQVLLVLSSSVAYERLSEHPIGPPIHHGTRGTPHGTHWL